MQTIGIVLNIGSDHVDEFERGFREMEAPIWNDLHARRALTMATLTRLDISTKTTTGAVRRAVDIFALRDAPTGAVLFLGRVADPSVGY